MSFAKKYKITAGDSLLVGHSDREQSVFQKLKARYSLTNTGAFIVLFVMEVLLGASVLGVILLVWSLALGVPSKDWIKPDITAKNEVMRISYFLLAAFVFYMAVLAFFTVIHLALETYENRVPKRMLKYYAQLKPFAASVTCWAVVAVAANVTFNNGQFAAAMEAARVPAAKTSEKADTIFKTIDIFTVYVSNVTYHDIVKMTLWAITIGKALIFIQKTLLVDIAHRFNRRSTESRIHEVELAFKTIEELRAAYVSKSLDLDEAKGQGKLAHYKKLKSHSEEIGAQIFAAVKSISKSSSVELSRDDFRMVLTEDKINALFDVIDLTQTETAGVVDLQHGIEYVYHEKVNIEKTLRDNDVILMQVDEGLILLTRCLIVFTTFRSFHFDIFWSGIATAGSAVVVLFAIKDTVNEISRSIILLFLYHPYDIGDKIVVDGTELVVSRIGFLVTTCKGPRNETIYMKNAKLGDSIIQNLRRSGHQGVTLTVPIHPETSVDAIDGAEKKINVFLAQNGKDYHPKCSIGPLQVASKDKMDLSVSYTHRANFQDGGLRSERDKRFNLFLWDTLREQGIQLAKK